MQWFKKRQYTVIKKANRPAVTPGNTLDNKQDKALWEQCPSCREMVLIEVMQKFVRVCPQCSFHIRLSARERIEMLADEGTFFEMFDDVKSENLLNFPDYDKKLSSENAKTDAIITGTATIDGKDIALGIMNFGFMGGSMGAVVGERIARLFEMAIEKDYPVLLSTISGGARMQEGIVSLMQMAKTSAIIAEYREKCKRVFITLLCDPTTGGTAASFAMLGDVIIAEPNALVGFAGPRVIEQTIRQKLPPGFQRSEFLLEHGFLDMIVQRKELKETISKLITWL